MPRMFAQRELESMDDFTANNEIVVASLGGMPSLPGSASPEPEEYDLERHKSQPEPGVARQRIGSMHR